MTTISPLTVNGWCPMGCGRTLYLANTGNTVCSHFNCPDHLAVTRILENKETEHIVTFKEDEFTVKHPLRERINDDLVNCQLHLFVKSLSGPWDLTDIEGNEVGVGTYRAVRRGEAWLWEDIDGAS